MFRVERLIQLVRAQPFLYNRGHVDYKDYKRKAIVWNEIANELGAPVAIVRKKWKNLRDSFGKCMKSHLIGDKKFKQWQWSSYMEDFSPYIGIGADGVVTENLYFEIHDDISGDSIELEGCNIESKNIGLDDEDEMIITEYKIVSSEFDYVEMPNKNSMQELETPREKQVSPIKSIIVDKANNNNTPSPSSQSSQKNEEGQKRESHDDMDAIEHIFLGYAKTVKQFSPKRRAVTKLKIAKIIMEAEVEHHLNVAQT